MRAIKFRGKRLDNREWRHCTSIEVAISGNVLIGYEEVDPATVGQFTGLLDKNGQEVYEGDVLGANGKTIGFVKGGVRGYCYDVVYTKPLSNGEKRWSLYATIEHDYNGIIEIIGNIHDTPELLKTK